MSVLHKKEIVIKDACIFFDLIDLGLLSVFYKLDVIVITTPQVINEIIDTSQLTEVNEYIENGKLKIDNEGGFEILTFITQNNPGLSFSDASVLEVAERIGASILSSDKSLRNVSGRQGLLVRGLLWVLEELYIQRLIELDIMFEMLSFYEKVNQRAPKKEIQHLKEKYFQKP
jgi:predicted nucleic acid-binding protein